MALLAANGCGVHRVHTPKNQTVEAHHLVPVGWQLRTLVPRPQPYPGPDPDGRGLLWDDRTIILCPTGHRNTHYWIVRLMRAVAQLAVDDPQAAYKAVAPRRPPVELPIALQALVRYRDESGASLLALTAEGEYGQV